jgi:hypothetical protein
MSQSKSKQPERVPLASFLERLEEEAARQAQAAAMEIDGLEGRAQGVRGIERQLEPYFYVALLGFVMGFARLIGGENVLFGLLYWIDGLAIAFLMAGLPILGFYYAFRVRWRTVADARSFDLNQQHFMPHGGIYFPAGEEGEPAAVILVDPDQGWKPRPSKYDKVKPGWMW